MSQKRPSVKQVKAQLKLFVFVVSAFEVRAFRQAGVVFGYPLSHHQATNVPRKGIDYDFKSEAIILVRRRRGKDACPRGKGMLLASHHRSFTFGSYLVLAEMCVVACPFTGLKQAEKARKRFICSTKDSFC
jgi:hypothetical protein